MAALLLILCQHTLEDVKMGKRNWEAYNVTYEAYFKFFPLHTSGNRERASGDS